MKVRKLGRHKAGTCCAHLQASNFLKGEFSRVPIRMSAADHRRSANSIG